MVAVEAGTSTTSVAVSTGAGGGVFGERSGAGKGFPDSGDREEAASFMGDPAGVLSDYRKRTPRLRERLASSTFQQARLHAK